MCGIAGVLHFDGREPSLEILKGMTDMIAHRGPDGEGQWASGPVGLGHRRLAILDLTDAGRQPMFSEDGRYAITYNGEVYNFRELRDELQGVGYRFHSGTDTEVVLKAFAHWHHAALDRFNGMFAFAIWDRQQQELFLARDRYGIKPLYYTRQNGAFLFASEVKAIEAHPAYRFAVDKQALVEYFTFQNFFSDRTLYQDVHLLPAGNYLRVKAPGTSVTPVAYWDFEFSEVSEPLREEEYIEELVHLFTQAVKRQLVSDVEIGSYLSGGMDSGSITAVASQASPWMRTFTCGFDLNSASGLELGFDEREQSEYMSYLFKTEHYEMVLKPGDMQRCLPRLAWHLEEPRVGQSYPNYYVAQLASKFVKVVLSGAGGDELFGGYPWRYYRAVVNTSFSDYVDKYYSYWQRLVGNGWLEKVFRPIWKDVQDVAPLDIFRDVFRTHAHTLTRPEDYVNHSLYFEAKTFLHGLLVVEDKLSMAHGLETRVPFLDNDLVDFASRIPVRMRLANLGEVIRLNENEPGLKTAKYFEKTRDGKLILRRAMQHILPQQITEAVKQGFSAPDASWFQGESIDYVKQTLFDHQSPLYEFLDAGAVKTLVGDHLEGRVNRRLLIWSLLNVHHWLTQRGAGCHWQRAPLTPLVERTSSRAASAG